MKSNWNSSWKDTLTKNNKITPLIESLLEGGIIYCICEEPIRSSCSKIALMTSSVCLVCCAKMLSLDGNPYKWHQWVL